MNIYFLTVINFFPKYDVSLKYYYLVKIYPQENIF